MAVVPNATALQVQLGDDDARTARGLALLADTETRLAALGEISKPVHALKFLNLEYKAVYTLKSKNQIRVDSNVRVLNDDHLLFLQTLVPTFH